MSNVSEFPDHQIIIYKQHMSAAVAENRQKICDATEHGSFVFFLFAPADDYRIKLEQISKLLHMFFLPTHMCSWTNDCYSLAYVV